MKYKALFLKTYPILMPEIQNDDSEIKVVQKAQILSAPAICQFIAASHNRAMDGVDFYLDLLKFEKAFPAEIKNKLITDRVLLNDAIIDFMEWVEKLFYFPPSKDKDCWNSKQLEYEFACSIADDPLDASVLKVDEYYHGKLDWFAFDIDAKQKKGEIAENTPADYRNKTQTKAYGVYAYTCPICRYS